MGHQQGVSVADIAEQGMLNCSRQLYVYRPGSSYNEGSFFTYKFEHTTQLYQCKWIALILNFLTHFYRLIISKCGPDIVNSMPNSVWK